MCKVTGNYRKTIGNYRTTTGLQRAKTGCNCCCYQKLLLLLWLLLLLLILLLFVCSCCCCCCCCQTTSHLYLDTAMLHVARSSPNVHLVAHYYAKRVALFTQKWPWLMMMIARLAKLANNRAKLLLLLLLLHLAKTVAVRATCCQHNCLYVIGN